MTHLYQDFLAHHGVEGMKWGQHIMAGKNVNATEAANKKDYERKRKKVEKEISKRWVKIHNNVTKRSATEFNKVTEEYEAKYGRGWSDDVSNPVYGKYLHEMADLDDRLFKEEARNYFKGNPAYSDDLAERIPTYGQIRLMANEWDETYGPKKRS